MTGDFPPAQIVVDRTHMGRRATGIERVTEELFSPQTLSPLRVKGFGSGPGRPRMITRQMLSAPISALSRRGTVWVFPGYPPSPAFLALRDRAVLYVHDLFLLTRGADLKGVARLYSAPLFRAAIRGMRYFFANSQITARQLKQHVRKDAEIRLYRPGVGNVFGLGEAALRRANVDPVRIGALGTVEPRKNLVAGARICAALAGLLGQPVEFHVVGRKGWGTEFDELSRLPHVRLHGFLPDEEVRSIVGSLDLFLCTSHDEGLGLPLLEVQYAGLPVVAPDQPVFREVLGASGRFIDPADPNAAAAVLAGIVDKGFDRLGAAADAKANLDRWNRLAREDRVAAVSFLSALAEAAGHPILTADRG